MQQVEETTKDKVVAALLTALTGGLMLAVSIGMVLAMHPATWR